MKSVLIQTLLVVATLSTITADERRAPLFTIPVIGFTDLNAIDYTEGVASGLWGTDMRGQWSGCLNGFTGMFEEVIDIGKDIFGNITNPAALFTNLSKFQKIFNLIITIVKDGPKDFKQCAGIVDEVTTGVGFIIKKINLATLTTGLAVNVSTHIMGLITDIASMGSAIFGWDWYTLGQDQGEIFMILFN